jgi:asparagine synthase (glutamine-hydrolysing)
VLFGSEINALLRDPTLPRDLDHVALHQTLAYLWTPAPRTMLSAVEKVRPGHALLLRGGRVLREWSFYDLPYRGERLTGRGMDDVAAEVARLVEQAVSRQMMADVPVGAFLSGGLDSSAVVAMMRRARPGYRPVCYSIGFADGAGVDGAPADLPYARRVAEHLDVDLRTIEVQPSMIDNLERMLYHLDEPQADPAPIHAMLIAEQARRDGIKVLLSGAGGDDIFTGYRRHRALQMERAWSWLPRGARGVLMRAGTAAGARSTAARRVTKAFANAALDPETRTVAYLWWSGEATRRALYAPDLARELSGEDAAAPLLESLARIPGERDRLNRLLYLEGKHFLADHNLNYTDKTGMAHGVEARVPLLDLDLVDFATRIPVAMKQRGSVGKAVFKRAMEPYLPHDVIYRPKSGFGAPLRQWMRNELRERMEDTLSTASLERRGLFDPAAVRALGAADRAGTVDGAYTLFALMCVELWCRMFVDGTPGT